MAKLFAGSNKTNPKSYKTGFHDEFHETRFIVVSNYLSGNLLNFGPTIWPFSYFCKVVFTGIVLFAREVWFAGQ
jgi:hypothetical protein